MLSSRISLTVNWSLSIWTLSPTSYGCFMNRKMIEVKTSAREEPISQLKPVSRQRDGGPEDAKKAYPGRGFPHP